MRCLLADQRAVKCLVWACYRTDLYLFELEGFQIGVFGCTVGASFAVRVAEKLFASGCELLIGLTSAGQLIALRNPPYFGLIEKALRDGGLSLAEALLPMTRTQNAEQLSLFGKFRWALISRSSFPRRWKELLLRRLCFDQHGQAIKPLIFLRPDARRR